MFVQTVRKHTRQKRREKTANTIDTNTAQNKYNDKPDTHIIQQCVQCIRLCMAMFVCVCLEYVNKYNLITLSMFVRRDAVRHLFEHAISIFRCTYGVAGAPAVCVR